MISISLDTAARLLGQTKRHIRRRIAEGSLVKVNSSDVHGRTHIPFDAIRMDIGYPLTDEDISAIVQADTGDPVAQQEVALFFLEFGDTERALIWLQMSALSGCADAMLMLGECYIEGLAMPGNGMPAIQWIERAAETGMMLAVGTLAALKWRVEFSG